MTSFKWLMWEHHELPPEKTQHITEEVNIAYAKALLICAKGDGVITPREREWVVGYMSVAGVLPSVVEMVKTYDGGDSIDDLLKVSPVMPAHRRTIVYDALRMCASDGELHPAEYERIQQMADAMGISREVVAELEAIVREDAKLRKRRHKVVMADALAEG